MCHHFKNRLEMVNEIKNVWKLKTNPPLLIETSIHAACLWSDEQLNAVSNAVFTTLILNENVTSTQNNQSRQFRHSSLFKKQSYKCSIWAPLVTCKTSWRSSKCCNLLLWICMWRGIWKNEGEKMRKLVKTWNSKKKKIFNVFFCKMGSSQYYYCLTFYFG